MRFTIIYQLTKTIKKKLLLFTEYTTTTKYKNIQTIRLRPETGF